METSHPVIDAIERQLAGCRAFFYDAWVSQWINGISGDYAEFGSWGAATMSACYGEMQRAGMARHMWAFDSWQGLPPSDNPKDQHPGWTPGSEQGQGGVEQFHAACAQSGIPGDAYSTISGYFDESLPRLGTDGAPTDIALAYIDCNLYSSTVSVFEFLAPRLKHGMIVAFDDYFCWSPDQVSGERAALHEFLQANPQWHFERYKDVHRAGVSFVVESSDQLG